MTYQPTDSERAVYSWLAEVAGTGVEVRFAMQAAPRPDAPFVTLQVISDTANQSAEVVTVDVDFSPAADGYVTRITEHRVATVSVNAFGAAHRAIMARIERSIFDPHVVDLNTQNGVEVQEAIGPTQDLSELVATDYVGRTQLDFRVAYTAQTDSPFATRIINRADISGILNDVTTQQTEP